VVNPLPARRTDFDGSGSYVDHCGTIETETSGFTEVLNEPLGTGRWIIFGLTTHCGDALETYVNVSQVKFRGGSSAQPQARREVAKVGK
jgi:hypothetical protein